MPWVSPYRKRSAMKNFSDSLWSVTASQLQAIQLQNPEPIQYAAQSVKTLVLALEKLKTHFLTHPPCNKSEEIEFFRHIKPSWAAKLIYYNEIYTFAANKPVGKKAIRKYYLTQIKKIKAFYDDHAEFCKYIRTGNNILDHKYFIRGKYDVRHTLDSSYLQADPRFSTSHDYICAKLIANEQLLEFIQTEKAKLKSSLPASNIPSKKIKWTASKIHLIELLYALHTQAAFNNGTADLKEIANYFEEVFEIKLGQFNKAFIEIRQRKSEQTKFLTMLQENLNRRMAQIDN